MNNSPGLIPSIILLSIMGVAIWKSPKHITLGTYTDKKVLLVLGSLFLITILLCRHFELPELYMFFCKPITVFLFIGAIFTREKIDDERSQQLRYFSLKWSFMMMVGWCILRDGSKLGTFQPIMSAIALYFIVFYLANYFNPDYLFKEETTKGKANIVYFVVSAILLVYIVKIIITITDKA